MGNPETLATMGHTRHRTKKNKWYKSHTTQKTKRWATQTLNKRMC